MTLAVSTGKVDITPGAGMETYVGGYGTSGADFRQAIGTYSPLYARCLVLWDDGYPNAIVSIDALAMPRSINQAIRPQLVQLNSQWNTSDIVLATTHTHNGPVLVEELDPFMAYNLTDLTLVTSYSNGLQAQIVNLVDAVLAAPRVPCTLDYQVATQSFAFNREGLSYVETAVPVLVARGSDGLPKAVLFGYGCHPVSAGVQTLWDGDFPAAACSVVEAAIPGCFAIYLTGAAGDQDPKGIRNWNLRNKIGAVLGGAVVSAASTAGRPITGPLETSYEEIALPLDITNTPANISAVRAAYQSRLANSALAPWYRRHAQRMIEQIQSNTFETSVPLPLQVWRLRGNPTLRLAMTGGELVSGYAAYFRGRYGGTNGLFMAAYVNECPGYICSDELLPPKRSGGSYGGGWDTDFPGIAGGSMTVYGCIGHLKAGPSGAEERLISGLNRLLA